MSRRKVVIRRFDEMHYGVGVARGDSFDLLFALHWEALHDLYGADVVSMNALASMDRGEMCAMHSRLGEVNDED